MGLELAVVAKCELKNALGNGNTTAGLTRMIASLKAAGRADLIVDLAKREGKKPEEIQVQFQRVTNLAGGAKAHSEGEKLNFAALRQEADVVKPYVAECASCPANLAGGAECGCYRTIKYPISFLQEQWLLDCVQPLPHIGAEMYLQVRKSFGEGVSRFRRGGLLESGVPFQKVVKKGLLGGLRMTIDGVLHMLMEDVAVSPTKAAELLVWLNRVELDGKKIESRAQYDEFLGMKDLDERIRRVKPDLGSEMKVDGDNSLKWLVLALHRCWLLPAPLFVDG